MLTFIVSVFASLAIVFGAPAPAPVAIAQDPAAAAAAAAADTAVLTDAWTAIDALGINAGEGNTEMMLSYVSTEDSTPNVATVHGYFYVSSQEIPNTYHVFKWDTISHA